jgi:hypothetical protein
MDCEQNFPKVFNFNPMGMPKVAVEWTFLNEGREHFSYEQIGSFRDNLTMLALQSLITFVICKAYLDSVKQSDKYLTPHPVILSCLVL